MSMLPVPLSLLFAKGSNYVQVYIKGHGQLLSGHFQSSLLKNMTITPMALPSIL